MTAGDAAQAEKCFLEALQIVPDFLEALVNLAWLQEGKGAFADAEASYWHALEIDPANVQLMLNLGVFLMQRKRFPEAETVYLQALAVMPDSAAVWSNYGVLLACLKREDEAEQCYRCALEIDGSYTRAGFNFSYILLRQGRFAEGWHYLESRQPAVDMATHFTCPRWRGEALAGKSVLIGFEGGHGDMIQFCRYAGVLKDRGAQHIAILCQPALKTLFASLQAVDQVFDFHENIPASDWDFWTPLLSLPHYCQTTLETIPAVVPYLTADPVRAGHYATLLPLAALRVGLVWQGNALFENDADRSLPSLALLRPLMEIAGIQFVSVQKGAGQEQLPLAGFPVLPLGAALEDFADTAALMVNLDLVISVDTAVAHLAGALGTPCWLLLPDYRTDWRWLTGRLDTPWYPGMRLFRQNAGGSWPAVIASVKEALELLVQERSAA